MVKRLINNLLFRIIDFDQFWASTEKWVNDSLSRKCIVGKGSFFYKEAAVQNMQKKSNAIVIGSNTHIRGELQVFAQGGQISIGDHCYLGENSKVWSAAKIEIGNRVLIAHNVNIHDNISHPLDSELRHKDYKRILGLEAADVAKFDLRAQKVLIEDDVWIGFNSIILKGVRIGARSIVGAGTFVSEDVPSDVVVGGNPMRIIRSINNSL